MKTPGLRQTTATPVARRLGALALPVVLAVTAAGCGDIATLPPKADEGPRPQIVPPANSLIPTINIAPAEGWPQGGMPVAAPDLPSTLTPEGSITHAGCIRCRTATCWWPKPTVPRNTAASVSAHGCRTS